MERVTGSDNIARICEGLSSPYRVEIMKILLERGPSTFRNLIEELKKRGYGKVNYALIRHHATIMTLNELVTFSRGKIYIVSPLSRIEIYEEKL